MGRPELRSDCADLEWFQQDQNIVCSRNLLEALRTCHGSLEDELIPFQTVEAAPQIESDALPDLPEPYILVPANKVEQIKRAVCKHFGITRSNLESASRKMGIVRPRQIGIYLARKHTTHSYPEIGRRFGGRDHTTILHAFRKIESLCQADAKIAADVASLEASIA